MKYILWKIKKCTMAIMLILCVGLASWQTPMTVQAYTQEEIDAAKAWLSANGYSPDMGGAQAAYADYMNGKFGAIPGLPEPNVPQSPSQETPSQDTPQSPQQEQPSEEQPEKEKPNDAGKEDAEAENPETEQPGAEVSAPQSPGSGDEPETEAGSEPNVLPDDEASEGLKELVESVELPEGTDELVLPTPSQQEFADMIDVFISGFSESEQEEIKKAKERLERQKQERAQAEKEAEGVTQVEHKPQKNIVMILGAVLAAAVIGLIVVIVKKNSEK